MTPLGARLVPLPGPVDAAFLEGLDAAAAFGAARPSPELAAALASVAALSPFLRAQMLADPKLLDEVLNASLAQSLSQACTFEGEAEVALRLGKRRIALAVALADLCGGASVEEVTGTLSAFADAAVREALAEVLRDAHRRGHAKSADADESGIIILGMGKLGGNELNYSSDIDLVVLYDAARARAAGLSGERIVRMTQRLSQLLNARTADGYVFRVDLRLRPDPGSTPLAVSTTSAIAYYQSRARAWERQAMIKARQIAGDTTAGARYLAALAPSVWHTAYDFGAIDETLAMREQIAAVKGAGEITAPGHNIKIGRGGIREIEFFVQSLQKVAGGRDPTMRGRSTLPMLEALARKGWVTAEHAERLAEAYRYLRRVEHRLQMVGDEQVHTLPGEAGLERIARMMGGDDIEADLRATLQFVHERFGSLDNGSLKANPLLAPLGAHDKALDEAMRAAFEEKAAIWRKGEYPSLRSERARALLRRLEPSLANALAATPNHSDALESLDSFFARLPSGVDFLSRLDRQRELVPVLVLIVSATPRLAERLVQRTRLLDVLGDPQFYGKADDALSREELLDAAIADAADYEGRLDALRVFKQEQLLLIDVRILTGSLSSAAAGEAITALAELVASRALDVSLEEFAKRHGHVEGGGVALLALGSFGGFEMTPASDLDIVFIYSAADEAKASDGDKPLTPGHYYSRAAQRFIAALSAPTARGKAFDVDLRLRPSGRAGPLATHIRSFERYHEESAWVWEHMALTRARVVAGDEELGERAMRAIREALTRPRQAEELAREVIEMRRRLDGLSQDDAKHAPGGLVDIEFIAQFLRLKSGLETDTTRCRRLLIELGGHGELDDESRERLIDSHRVLRKLMLLFAIAGVDAVPEEAPAALQPLLLREADAPDIAYLKADLAARRVEVRQMFERLIGPLAQDEAQN